MGFSVSASAAIIFISFLGAAITLYAAWDSAYADVKSAQEFWYDLKISQMSTDFTYNETPGHVYFSPTTYSITLVLINTGRTLYAPYWSGVYDGRYITLYNVSDDNVGFSENYTYILPGDYFQITIANIPRDTTTHNLTITVENGCWFRLSWYYDGTTVLVLPIQRGCPTEVD
ncbi:flagella [Pyrococcus furiosus DSM 3638]|uniref:Flagella n=2 Tax=Pyrococcus furiosus TaxID=2261 RepID=A0A5C0XTH3_PYRFU|nr:flagellin [Pyrococcus furiosus]AFN03123.1 flagella-like protein [Pyrococcus furiosus COM1]QEK78050.1 flagella [Pyrococcus furiosus DSM 3638]